MPSHAQNAGIYWSLAVGLIMFAVVYVTVFSGWFRKAENDAVPPSEVVPDAAEPVHHFPGGLSEGHGGVPLILKSIIIGFLVFLVAYVALFLQAWNGPLGALDRFLTQ